ncbi:unnamed protein product [Protopolystoma xenopodis]|uniref:Transcription initiation factor IIA subunit 2 n=1 Tax=Protopolystoma xenopodis TaxID=117903 RepID=A0A448X6G8_9PLAT|nr:unnamed protein product [Protopolystoma xenopodis]
MYRVTTPVLRGLFASSFSQSFSPVLVFCLGLWWIEYIKMSYHQMYRRTTLGNTLQEALEEMIALKLIQPKTAVKVIQKFDQCISLALARRVKNRLLVRGHLNAYRFCDNVWTFVMNDVEIKDASTVLVVDKVYRF